MQGKVCGKKRHTKTEIRSEISELICGRIAAGENYNLTRDKYEEMADAGLLPFSIFIDDTESEYVFEEITEENCWIIKNLINGRYFTASTEFMQEYELLEGLEESNNGN